MSKVFLKGTRPLNKIEQVEAHAKYVGFRSKETKEKGFYSRDEDRANYKDFLKRIESNKALKHSKSIKAHKMIFSLKEVDYNAYKRSGKDYKVLLRSTLGEYEKRHDVKLDWIANTHEKEGHPHSHVIIKGVSDKKDADGRYKRIKFTKDDYKELKEIFDKEFFKDVEYKDHELEKTLLDKSEQERILYDITKGFDMVAQDISRDIERKHRLEQIEREREAEKSANRDRRSR